MIRLVDCGPGLSVLAGTVYLVSVGPLGKTVAQWQSVIHSPKSRVQAIHLMRKLSWGDIAEVSSRGTGVSEDRECVAVHVTVLNPISCSILPHYPMNDIPDPETTQKH